MSMHSFDPAIAAQVGVVPAVIYQNIVFWHARAVANGKHQHDGRTWVYNSVKAWGALFPYLTPKQIRGALEKLEEAGLVATGCYNQTPYDRTKWYCPLGQLDLPSGANEIAATGQPIPVSNPVSNPRDSSSAERPSSGDIERAFNDQFWAAYPRHVGKGAARAKFIAQAKKNGVEVIMAGLARAIGEWKSQGTEAQFIPHPATWLNQERWEDEPLSQSAARKGNHIDNDPVFSGWDQPAGWTPENDTYRPSGNSGNARDNVDPAFTGW